MGAGVELLTVFNGVTGGVADGLATVTGGLMGCVPIGGVGIGGMFDDVAPEIFVGEITVVVTVDGELVINCGPAAGLLLIIPGVLFARLLKAGDDGGLITVLPGPIGLVTDGALCRSLDMQPVDAHKNMPAPTLSSDRFHP